ncbi:uncharacterized protein EV422DRAFT_544763 [Fimicolochytrium jonesii]|uniref:uncharacterized protein n=1 Tax=Fimicolochytrium jonesii TaxID=1396493 RepID=UPI0022FE5574|nr:uncharacterized protein EV422DRAFT_544763 [Fimicolochytrium jonesii]KAI8816562.1 hypothetical protein EV422DRAFT_544763 [Fimicolochytrium jonesii]
MRVTQLSKPHRITPGNPLRPSYPTAMAVTRTPISRRRSFLVLTLVAIILLFIYARPEAWVKRVLPHCPVAHSPPQTEAKSGLLSSSLGTTFPPGQSRFGTCIPLSKLTQHPSYMFNYTESQKAKIATTQAATQRILFMVVTGSAYRDTPNLVFISDVHDPEYRTIGLKYDGPLQPQGKPAGYPDAWIAAQKRWFLGFQYIIECYLDAIDYVMVADDDTFLQVERATEIAAMFKPTADIGVGYVWRNQWPWFLSGGAGYLLSSTLLQKLYGPVLDYCLDQQVSDVALGEALVNKLKVWPIEHPSFFWHNYQYFTEGQGVAEAAMRDMETPVSFHYVPEESMAVLEEKFYK